MPLLDMSDVLEDIDFLQTIGLMCERNAQAVGEDGIARNTKTNTKFAGVVTSLDGDKLQRGSDGERISGSILIITKFRLIAGNNGNTADIVNDCGRTYTVTDVNNYSKYGQGFVEATCTLIPFRPK